MESGLFIIALIVLTVFPVMAAGKLFGAGKTGFFACAGAAVVSVVAGNMAANLIQNPMLAALFTLTLSAVGFAYLLEAKILQSFLIALLAMALQWAMAAVFVAFGINVDHFAIG